MEYDKAIDYLFNSLPSFEKSGASGYKPGLGSVTALSEAFGSPHKAFPTIHIAGTNGKGSTASTLSAILESAGYKTGLYTSPHLVDFRERIRINGEMISREEVCAFTERALELKIDAAPTFFELATVMAFKHFADNEVDIAVIETGLGGRLDSTNIIDPEISIITNISLDHTAQLGNTLASIAAEKAGIIKPGHPVIVGEAQGDVLEVITAKAQEQGSPLILASEAYSTLHGEDTGVSTRYSMPGLGEWEGELCGKWQLQNARAILAAVDELRKLGWNIPDEAVRKGFAEVSRLTGLFGRWTIVCRRPLTVVDTGHNPGAWEELAPRIAAQQCRQARVLLGFVADKDVDTILAMLPRDAVYYFTQPSSPRALRAETLAEMASRHGLTGAAYPSPTAALGALQSSASPDDFIFIGGSNYLVGQLMAIQGDK